MKVIKCVAIPAGGEFYLPLTAIRRFKVKSDGTSCRLLLEDMNGQEYTTHRVIATPPTNVRDIVKKIMEYYSVEL